MANTIMVQHMFKVGGLYKTPDGKVLKIDTDVEPATSAQDMAATLGELGVAKR